MSEATPMEIDIAPDDLGGGATSYDDFQPGEYVGILTEVSDVKANSGNVGWRWTFQVNGLDFNIVTWLKGGGLWKLEELISAMGGELKPGPGQKINPNLYVGSKAGLRIGPDKTAKDERYRDRNVILSTFPSPEGGSMFDVPDTF